MAPFVCGENGSIRDLDHVTWHVRFTVLMQLIHCRLRGRDVWTLAPGESGAAIADRAAAVMASAPAALPWQT
ncbi:MAG: hypothetical protein ABMA13_22210 [Chthoniobacteraceae bacterium]